VGVARAVAVALALALAGCSEATPTQEVRSGSTVATTVASRPTSSVPPTTGAPGRVDPSPPLTGDDQGPAEEAGTTLPPATTVPGERGPAHRWEGYTVGADGATLTFTYYAGVEPCSVFDSIVAEEGPDTVRVSIFERSGGGDTVCIMLAQLKSATVTLAAPLGGRTVVDGAT
jgi:hypothetical protein